MEVNEIHIPVIGGCGLSLSKQNVKAKWRIHSLDEPLVWDATAQDMETGIRVKINRQHTDTHANRLAVQKLLEELKLQGKL